MALLFDDVECEAPVKIRNGSSFAYLTLQFFKDRYIVLHKASSSGPIRFVLKHSRDGNVYKQVALSDVKKITGTNVRGSLAINMSLGGGKSSVLMFENDAETQKWFIVLKEMERIAKSNDAADFPAVADMFHVFLLPSSTVNLKGECMLKVSDTELLVYDHYNIHHPLLVFPLDKLRSYGKDNDMFTIETGRKFQHGEGLFAFHSVESEAIHTLVKRNCTTMVNAIQVANSNVNVDEVNNIPSNLRAAPPNLPRRSRPLPPTAQQPPPAAAVNNTSRSTRPLPPTPAGARS